MSNVKFKETNQICSALKISQSVNAESAYDRNNKSMYSCFMKARNILAVWCIEREKNRRYRSSRPEVFCKKVFLKTSQKSQENTCARVSEFCEISKNTFSYRTLLVAASVDSENVFF